MPYELGFLNPALKQWRKLDSNTRDQFKKKLGERLINPRVPSAQLRGSADRYKIKLRSVGYRLEWSDSNIRIPLIQPDQANVRIKGPLANI